jgi:D-tyrosyl-tRNA(Tyr) deacylase
VRVVVQRVSRACVRVDGDVRGEIGIGLLVLLGIAKDDAEEDAEGLARRIARLRIFPDDTGRFDRSLLDTGGAALVVSQFTLLSESGRQKGARPDFSNAARPEVAGPLYDRFCESLSKIGLPVQTGVFGARMEVELVNDGPVTIILET